MSDDGNAGSILRRPRQPYPMGTRRYNALSLINYLYLCNIMMNDLSFNSRNLTAHKINTNSCLMEGSLLLPASVPFEFSMIYFT